jgi:hypothetical protein
MTASAEFAAWWGGAVRALLILLINRKFQRRANHPKDPAQNDPLD